MRPWPKEKRVGRLPFVVACLLPIVLPAGLGAQEKSDDVIAGTYDVRVCQGPCTFDADANVLAKGSMVFFAKALEPAQLGLSGHHRFHDQPGEPVNACYSFDRVGGSKILVSGVGSTSWSWQDGRYTFALFHSPDAGYQVTAERTPTGLSGT